MGFVRLWFARRESWIPGAEGAPREGTVEEGADLVGTMRRAIVAGGSGRRCQLSVTYKL